MNHIAIAGNLGLDASLKYTTSGKPVTNLFILVDNGYGANKKSAFGFGVVAWDDLAESAGKLTKGQKVTVYGKLTSRKYQNKSGVEVTKVEIVADAITAWKPRDTDSVRSPEAQPVAQEVDLDSVPF